MPLRALVVDGNQAALSASTLALASAGYQVMCASQFGTARQRLAFAPPDLIIAAMRLGAYNGLHLVLHGRAVNPGMPAIVMDERPDPVLEVEAKKMDAVYLGERPDHDALVSLVGKLLAGVAVKPSSIVERRWPRKPAAISVGVAGAHARLVDVSYGGLRVELSHLPDECFCLIDAVVVPRVGRLPVHSVWTQRGASAPVVWWCGVEFVMTEPHTVEAWRTFLDSLN